MPKVGTVCRLAVAALLLALAGLCQPASADGRRVALVVGNDRYANEAQLRNAANDARLIAKTLQSLGFTLVGGGAQIDLDKAGFDRAVRRFGAALQGADIAFFYYSGHGMQVDGRNWLLPVDAQLTRPQDLEFVMNDAGTVLRQMQGANTRLNVMLLDACRSNPFLETAARGGARGLAEMRAPEGTLISYATQPDSVASDGAGNDSPYALALVDAMRQPGLDLFQMFNRVGVAVKHATHGEQLPWVSNSPIEGDFYFAGPLQAAPPTPPTPPTPPVAAAPVVAAAQAPAEAPAAQPARPAATPAPQAATEAPALSRPADRRGTGSASICYISHYSLSRSKAGSEIPVDMTTSGDGWCRTTPKNSRGFGYPGDVDLQPTSGSALVQEDASGLNSFGYHAAQGFLGIDHVKFHVFTGKVTQTLDVTVRVVPAR